MAGLTDLLGTNPLGGAGSLLGSSQSSKSAPQFMTQYAGGLLGSLFFPQFAQAFASYKPQEYQQLFGEPGQKLKKSKGKVANAGEMGMGANGFATDPNSPLGINGSIGQYRRLVSQYNPFDYAASNPFGRPGGESGAEKNLLNDSYFGLTPMLDQSGAKAAANSLPDFLAGLKPENFGSQLGMIRNSMPQQPVGPTPQTPQIPQAPNVSGFQWAGSGNPLSGLIGLLGLK